MEHMNTELKIKEEIEFQKSEIQKACQKGELLAGLFNPLFPDPY